MSLYVSNNKDIAKRRAFAIIAHPDAGKTTLTEKLLLYGGAIQLAGHVRAKKDRKSTKSDWMKLEQDRGISINTSAMQFLYNGHVMNLLDTPGHEDFSEDTYRTLMAADCAIMLLDAAKGVEEQTVKLFSICKEKKIPIITLVNKMDRPALETLEIFDNIENTLGITPSPVTWPIGSGDLFRGFIHVAKREIHLFERGNTSQKTKAKVISIDDPDLKNIIPEDEWNPVLEEMTMGTEMLAGYDSELFLNSMQTPVFFGSAITNFGIEFLLENFLALAPSPQPVTFSDGSTLKPESNEFLAFIFKLQANMNKAHRDRVAFARILSGKFERGMQVSVPRMNKTVKLSSPVSFFGQERSTIDEAFPGDIIGLINPRLYQLGDILTTTKIEDFRPLPQFAPEAFARITCSQSDRMKSFKKGIMELAEEGVVQVFDTENYAPMIGGVGELQFEVFQFRLKDEYDCPTNVEYLPFKCSRWIYPQDEKLLPAGTKTVQDTSNNTVILFESIFRLQYFTGENSKIELLTHPPLAKKN